MVTGHILVTEDGKSLGTMYPARWFYRKHEDQPTTEVAIRRTVAEDLYLVMPAYELNDQSMSLQVVVTPLVNWIWAGFGILVLGTGIALLPESAFAFARRPRAGRGEYHRRVPRKPRLTMARKTTDKPRRQGPAAASPPPGRATPVEGGIRPWHLLLVATVIAIAVGVFATQGTSTVNTVAVAVAIGTVAWVAATAARTVAPLVAPEMGEQTEMVGGRTRAALEREKLLVLRSIKEVEFDRAMGKISDADFNEVAGRLRARAAGLLRQLDADSSGYRALIERELATRVGRAPATAAPAATSACRRRRSARNVPGPAARRTTPTRASASRAASRIEAAR